MTGETGYPVSLLLEGPLFRDELETPPQNFMRNRNIESLRLVPAKSAASGVHTIYFKPEHRQWALVRLASRYRGLFEIQLLRGMSGEYQLLRQDFTSADLGFLVDIIPSPPEKYSPIVYDMLWLVATYDEYLALTRAMVERETIVPKDVLRSTEGVNVEDDGFFTRFLRSHLIRPSGRETIKKNRGANSKKSNVTVDLGTKYKVTAEGSEALNGIVTEYERIFKRQEFKPLLINSELNQLEHLRGYESKSTKSTPEVSVDKMQNKSGILGDIAESFAPVDMEIDSQTASSETTNKTKAAGATKDERQEFQDKEFERKIKEESSVQDEVDINRSNSSEDNGNRSTEVSSEELNNISGSESDNQKEGQINGEFTREEVVQAAVASATVITEETLVRTSEVKTTAWETVDLSDRSQKSLWEAVQDILITMDSVHGRDGGYIWASNEFYN